MTANGCITAKGIGDIEIRAFTRGKTKEITIKDVLYIPEIKRNLLSVSKIEEKEQRVEFANRKASIIYQREIIAEATHRDGLYVLKATVMLPNGLTNRAANNQKEFLFNLNNQSQTINLWHRRMCHVNTDYIKKTQNLSMG